MEPPVQLQHLAICIPLHANYIPYLKRCLQSIDLQTRKVDSIHISLSQASETDEAAVAAILSTMPTLPKCHVHVTAERLLTGGNRNRAAAAATDAGATILFFFDADDVMHPRRIELIASHMERDVSITGILTRYLFGPKEKRDLDHYTVPWRELTHRIYPHAFTLDNTKKGFVGHTLKPACYVGSTVRGSNDVACGPITVRAEFWKGSPYDETIKIGEDQHFNSQILATGGNLAFLPDPLFAYMVQNKDEFDCSCKKCETVEPMQAPVTIEQIRAQLEVLKKVVELRRQARDALLAQLQAATTAAATPSPAEENNPTPT